MPVQVEPPHGVTVTKYRHETSAVWCHGENRVFSTAEAELPGTMYRPNDRNSGSGKVESDDRICSMRPSCEETPLMIWPHRLLRPWLGGPPHTLRIGRCAGIENHADTSMSNSRADPRAFHAAGFSHTRSVRFRSFEALQNCLPIHSTVRHS